MNEKVEKKSFKEKHKKLKGHVQEKVFFNKNLFYFHI